jgi:hypothetical protein
VLLVIAGVVLLVAAGSHSFVTIAGAVVLGIAAVWVVSLMFYEIGLGEDLDRARGGKGPYDR